MRRRRPNMQVQPRGYLQLTLPGLVIGVLANTGRQDEEELIVEVSGKIVTPTVKEF